MYFQIVLLGLSSVVNLFLGLLVLSRAYTKNYGRFFAVTTLFIAVWALGDALLIKASSEQLIDFGAKLFYFAPVPIPVFIWWFSIAFPNDHKVSLLSYIIGGVSIALWSFIIIVSPELIFTDVLTTNELNIPVINPVGFVVYALHFSMFFILTYITLFKKYKRSNPHQLSHTQLRYTLYGVLSASLLGMITNLSLPLLGNSRIIWLGPILTLIFVGFVAFAIIKHKLFDVKIFAARAIAYFFSWSIMISAYLVAIILVSSLVFNTPIKIDTELLTYILLGLAIVTGLAPLRAYFNRTTNKLFFQDAYDAEILLDQHNSIVVANNDVEPLLRQSVEVISEHIRPDFAAIVLQKTAYTDLRIVSSNHRRPNKDKVAGILSIISKTKNQTSITDSIEDSQELKEALQKTDTAVMIRLTVNEDYQVDGLGYLLLGYKKSGNNYTKQDIKMLQIISNELVIAIQNALRFEEIEKFAVTLQDKVATATAQLRKTNAKLQAMDETKDEFISMASHQLRTPLTSVKGYLSMVIEGDAGDLNEMQNKLLNQAFVSSQRMVYLIADLLNVSRLRTGKFMVDTKPTNLAEAVEGEIAQLKEVAKGRGLELTYEKPADFPVLPMDETKMRQVIMNFTDNAIYYTPTGGKITAAVKDTGDAIQFTVTDTGMGVPKSEQPHMFSKFYRAVNAKKARPDGTGLGLFMAKKVVVAQGGSIIFNSTEGKGSTFGFTFSKQTLKELSDKPKTTYLAQENIK